MVSEGDCRQFFLVVRDLLDQGRNLRPFRQWLEWDCKHDFATVARNFENLPPESLFEIRRALSIGQMESKLWLIDVMKGLVIAERPLSICVAGGWCGTLPLLINLLKPFEIKAIAQVDLATDANQIAKSVNKLVDGFAGFKAITGNALDFDYKPYDVIINTSCEHFSAEDLALWLERLPASRYVFLQSNNFFSEPGHINCHHSVFKFRKSLDLKTFLYTGEFELETYKRLMVAGITNYTH